MNFVIGRSPLSLVNLNNRRDRRRYRRVTTRISARFMRGDKQELSLPLVNMSATGVILLSPVSCVVGERIAAYLDHFGRIEAGVPLGSR
jgi:hypothetical protein